MRDLQDDFSEVLSEEDTQYGKMVFYSLENKDGMTGIGLAIFKMEEEYSEGTAHLLSPGDVATTDYIKINEEVKIVYGMEQEGLLREQVIKDGKYEDLFYFGIINPQEDIKEQTN